jgi:hypothetical protein
MQATRVPCASDTVEFPAVFWKTNYNLCRNWERLFCREIVIHGWR